MLRNRICLFASLCLLTSSLLAAQEKTSNAAPVASVSLPAPSTSNGMSLNEALLKRRSVRSFASTALTEQQISQLLWAAQGITDDKGHRTAPSAHAGYFVQVFLATAKGLYQYDPQKHALKSISDRDMRSALSNQQSVKEAPAVLAIMVESERAAKSFGPNSDRFVYLEAGHVAQNVLLEATALGLGAVPVGGIDPKTVSHVLGDPVGLEPVYLIPVGHAR